MTMLVPADPEDHAAHERIALDRLRDLLASTYEAHASADEVTAIIDEAAARYESVPIRDFVPLLVERAARDTLRQRAAAHSRRADPDDRNRP